MGQPAPRQTGVEVDRNRRTAALLPLIVLCIGQMMIVIDQNIVNVALPTLQRSLGFSAASLVWVVNAYVVPFGGLLLLAGRLGDLIGRKIIFLTGIVMFSAASLLCGLASSEAMLIVFRFVQGIGGAVASACILGMVATMYTDQRKQAQAIAAYSFASAGGGAVGPLLGGVLTDLVSWHWIFFINVPVGAVVALLGVRSIERDPGIGLDKGADFFGAALVTGGLMLGVYTIVHAEDIGWGSARSVQCGVLAILLLVGFVIREATAAKPMLPLSIFRSRRVSAANIVQFMMIAGMFGLLFFGTLYLQRVLGYSSLQAGLAYVPIALVIAAVALGLSARLIMRFGQRSMLFLGMLLIIAAFVMLAFSRTHGNYVVDFLPASVVMGLGFGIAAPAMMGLGMSGVAAADSGIASGLFNTTQQVGGAVGLTVLSAFVTARTNSLARAGKQQAESLTGGYHLAFVIGAIFVLGALLIAAVMLRQAAAPDEQQAPVSGTAADQADLAVPDRA